MCSSTQAIIVSIDDFNDISGTVKLKSMSLCRMRHFNVLLVFSLKLTFVKIKWPNKWLNLKIQFNNLFSLEFSNTQGTHYK